MEGLSGFILRNAYHVSKIGSLSSGQSTKKGKDGVTPHLSTFTIQFNLVTYVHHLKPN